MSYWISLVSDDKKHREIWDGVHCSWNYLNMMLNLPCGWAKFWQGKQAKEMTDLIENSLLFLKLYPEKYSEYENKDTSIKPCEYILTECFKGFKEHPDGIIRID